MLDPTKVSGIGEWTEEEWSDSAAKKNENPEKDKLYRTKSGKVFLVVRPKTIEVRSDARLGRQLREEYETVMESRYFGRGGIEIVPSGQLSEAEIEDLVRLSYNLSEDANDAEK